MSDSAQTSDVNPGPDEYSDVDQPAEEAFIAILAMVVACKLTLTEKQQLRQQQQQQQQRDEMTMEGDE